MYRKCLCIHIKVNIYINAKITVCYKIQTFDALFMCDFARIKILS